MVWKRQILISLSADKLYKYIILMNYVVPTDYVTYVVCV